MVITGRILFLPAARFAFGFVAFGLASVAIAPAADRHPALSPAEALTRFKLALTEDTPPTIKPYYEERWAELGDSKLPVDVSLRMVEAIHTRWVALLESMSDDDFKREFIHPETGNWPLENALALYAWHSQHHTAHITQLRDRNGW